jgi:hypothetical protein
MPSVVVAVDDEVVDGIFDRLQVFNVVKFDKEGYTPVFAKIEVGILGAYGETAAERPYAGVGIRNLVFAYFCHKCKGIIIFRESVDFRSKKWSASSSAAPAFLSPLHCQDLVAGPGEQESPFCARL